MSEYRGQFFDGRSSAPVPALVALGSAGLTIRPREGGTREGEGEVSAAWPYPELRLLEEVYDGRPARLRSLAAGDARLVVREIGFLSALAARAPQLRGFDLRGVRPQGSAIAWTLGLAATLVSLYFGIPRLAEPVAAVIPLAWEERLGSTVRQSFLAQLGAGGRECVGAGGVAALRRLTDRLAAAAPSRYSWRVIVVDTNEVNAVNLPGGYIVFFRGLIEGAQLPEEVAGVLAHEMGHGIERHTTEGLLGNIVLQIVVTVFAGDSSRWAATAAQVATRAHGRAHEREADRLGVDTLNRAGIRGAPLATWFRRLAAGSAGDRVNGYVSTHPPSAERADEVDARATGTGDAMSVADWAALRAICGVLK